jgi:hypothetical protein
MTFRNILHETICDCIENAFEDVSSSFGIKTNNPYLRDVDFKSKWEKGQPLLGNNCSSICGHRGVSMSLLSATDRESNLPDVFNIFKQIFPLSPSYKPFLSIIMFTENTGVLLNSPTSGNRYHHDFYKCDAFNLKQVKLIKVIPLSDENV